MKNQKLPSIQTKAVTRAALYVRVSTDAQREEGYSIDAQKAMLIGYCVSKNITDYDIYIDGGFTGSNVERPEMQRMITDIKNGNIDIVAVHKLDRLSRSQKDTLYLIEDVFNFHGVGFVSLQETLDTSTPMGRAMLGIMSAFAQLEREQIFERTRMGMRERVKSGLWMGGGRIPFGYDYDREQGILVPNEKESETVRKIYDLYIKGYSAQNIANMLGLKYDRLVYQIITRKTNIGIIEYNGVEYKGKHESIVSSEIFERAMTEMNIRSTKRVATTKHLLTGIVYCAVCGSKMRYQKWSKNGHKLVCYSRDKSKPYLVKDPNCDNATFWADDVEDAIIKDLFEFAAKKTYGETKEVSYSAIEILQQLLTYNAKDSPRCLLYASDSR